MSDIGASDSSDPLDAESTFTELVPVGEANIRIMNCNVIFGHISTDEKGIFSMQLCFCYFMIAYFNFKGNIFIIEI